MTQTPTAPGLLPTAALGNSKWHTIDATGTAATLVWDAQYLYETVRALEADNEPTSGFLTSGWLEAAASWRTLGAAVGVLVVRDGVRVLGAVPLTLSRSKYRGITYRELQFLSVPDTQLCAVISRPEHRQQVFESMARFLARECRDWDVLRLENLAADSGTPSALSAAFAEHGLRCGQRELDYNYGLSLEGDWQNYYARRSRRLKKGNNLVANRLKKAYGTIEVLQQRHELSDTQQLHEALDTVEAISRNSWKRSTGLTLDNRGPSQFIRTLSEYAAQRGALWIWQLLLDGVPVAFEYQLVHQGSVHALRADYRDDYQQAAPGTYLNWQILQQLFDQGLEHYYMGPGSNSYKERWAECEDPLVELCVYAGSPRGWLLHLLVEHARPLLKKLLRRGQVVS